MLERPSAVAFTGGLMRIASFNARVAQTLLEREPSATLVETAAEPAEGALFLARRR
jgi:hypothetical protein